MSTTNLFNSKDKEEDQWISVSDLMTGLMIIFLFIAISFIRDIRIDRDKIEEIAITWKRTQDLVYEDLKRTFEEDLKRWNARLIRENLTITFPESVSFKAGSKSVSPKFQEILNDFFPRYLKVLSKYKDKIKEIRIEGHTSSEWLGERSEINRYFKNMDLSQERTRSVLRHVLYQPGTFKRYGWAKNLITANGLSSSKLIYYKKNGKLYEDKVRSRRVEFKVVTVSKELIQQIISRNKVYDG